MDRVRFRVSTTVCVRIRARVRAGVRVRVRAGIRVEVRDKSWGQTEPRPEFGGDQGLH